MNRINENINNLREEIERLIGNTQDLIENLSDITEAGFARSDAKADYLLAKTTEFINRELESDYQEKLNEILSVYCKLSYYSDKHETHEILTQLFVNGILDASIERYTRLNESPETLYEYVSMAPGNDAFRWSPIEHRPILVERLRRSVLDVDFKPFYISVHQAQVQEEYEKYAGSPPAWLIADLDEPQDVPFIRGGLGAPGDLGAVLKSAHVRDYYEVSFDKFVGFVVPEPICTIKSYEAVLDLSPPL